MLYCNVGDKPLVTYQFSGSAEKRYQSQIAPIKININQLPDMAACDLLRVVTRTLFSNNGTANRSNNVYAPVTGTEIGPNGTQETASFLLCGGLTGAFSCNPNGTSAIQQASILNALGRPISCEITSIEILNKPNVPRYQIEIYGIDGTLLHKDSGLSVPTFNVKCGNCPQGTEEHKSSVYPGYCCLDCVSIAAGIRGITNTIKVINRG